MGWTRHYDEALPYVANEHSLVRGPGRQIHWDQVPDRFGGDAFTVTTTAEALADATSITVEALAGAVPAGVVLYFGADLFARLSAAADQGATTLSVEGLVTTVPAASKATYRPGRRGKVIPAGSIMAELSNGKIVPRSAVAGVEKATHILESTASDVDETEQAGYGVLVGGAIFQNLLPDASHDDFSTWIGELELAGVGKGWHWATYGDDTA